MRDAAFVKACELVVEFRKQASHWKKLLFATSDELSAARHALSDIATSVVDRIEPGKQWTPNDVVEAVRLGEVERSTLAKACEDLQKDGQHLLSARVRALKYSAQAEDARREIERLRSEVESLRAKLNAKGCEPCDPPQEASHDTPEGKRTAEGAVEPKPGDVVRLVRVPTNDEYPHDSGRWEPNWGGIGDYMRVHYVGSNINGTRVVRAVFGLEWPVSCVEVVKGADK